MNGSYWTRSVLLPLDTFQALNITPFEEVLLSTENRSVSIIVQAVPQNHLTIGKSVRRLGLHPFVQEFMVFAASKIDGKTCDDGDGSGYKFMIQHAFQGIDATDELNSVIVKKIYCQIQKLNSVFDVTKVANDDQFHLDITLHLICSTNPEYDGILTKVANEDGSRDEIQEYLLDQIKQEFECRTVQNKIFIPVSLPPLPSLSRSHHIDEFAIFFITDVKKTDDKQDENRDFCYSIGSSEFVSISVMGETADVTTVSKDKDITCGGFQTKPKELTNCPGYTALVHDIMEIAKIRIRGGCPTGILLSGCGGVGKTRLAIAVLDRLLETEQIRSSTARIISAKDIVLQASSSMDLSYLKKYIVKQLIISERTRRAFLIIDDLDVIADNNADDSSMDNEKRIALHSITGVIDDLNSRWKGGNDDCDLPPFILGICCNDSLNIQSDLIRVGRFEKVLLMSPPSENQRREILREMFKHLPIAAKKSRVKEELCDAWSMGVAPHTAGCVAADLKRICTDALTRSNTRTEMNTITGTQCDASMVWSDIREAARLCIPSQLAQLDVSLAANFEENSEKMMKTLSPKESFFRVWDDKFLGYNETKAKIFRTIFRPWKRHNSDYEGQGPISSLEREVPPPSGVLFHGQSGTGKTFAAECLASSLGLNVVRVRASDILDKWLGGSEAAIRAIFARARSAAPCILFFDELDAIATNREDDDGDSSDVHSRLLSTLLNEMDGVNSDNSKYDVLIVGTTNRINAIDAALKRPGRFEQHILLELPSISDVQDMTRKFLEKVPRSTEISLYDIAELLVELGASAADVKGVCSDACLNAIGNVNLSTHSDDIVLRASDLDEAICSWKR